jgi:UDP-N-acetylglucosamine 1-carboxyvinyltransferase
VRDRQPAVDIHLAGLERMGATIRQLTATSSRAKRLRGTRVALDFPSVGATENLMMAATLADGVTEIENAAREPEIEDLAAALVKMGARIAGAGHRLITIEGVRELAASTTR